VLDGSKCWTGSKNLRLKAEVCRSSRRNVCLHFTVLALPSERVPFRSMHRPVTLHRSRDIVGFATPQWLRPSLCPWYTAQRRVICPGVLGSTAPSVHRTDKSSLFEYTPPRARGRRDHATQLRGLWSGRATSSRHLTGRPCRRLRRCSCEADKQSLHAACRCCAGSPALAEDSQPVRWSVAAVRSSSGHAKTSFNIKQSWSMTLLTHAYAWPTTAPLAVSVSRPWPAGYHVTNRNKWGGVSDMNVATSQCVSVSCDMPISIGKCGR
jgi:hypothetical protein